MIDNRIKVCLVLPNVFPVPAVLGGACETLAETLIKENEVNKLIDLTCVSIYNDEAYEKSLNYKNTHFIYIKGSDEKEKIDLTFSDETKSLEEYADKVYDEIKNLDLDYIVIEGGNLKAYKKMLSKFPKEKRIGHFHGNFIYDEEYDDIYQYFLSCSNFVAQNFINGGLKDKDRVKVLYNGIEFDKFNKKIDYEEKRKIREKYNISENDNVIIFCGRIVPNKGIKELIMGFKNSKHLNDSKLLIVGDSVFGRKADNPFKEELKKLIEDVKDRVVFTGFVKNDELYKFHNIADIAIVPTISEEAFGLVVVEFLVSQLPLIVTNSGAFPEIVGEDLAITVERGECIVSNIAKAIDYLLDNPKLQIEMIKKSKEKLNQFSSNSYYKNFYNIVSELKENN